ncbi:TAXI family TRAP transporter solute-binding subunit [Streptomyces kanamyceticus]|uniref:TAXI family TRAP transporter solute-binding subunit n=1 Tax=Streptomyces kanamyceticus TaxID=1967 RepID=A0A5J6G8R8_STRKN|nr:TAXI family TRAP transporter solute-binding subunit [Streptomyces kanamyceticus]QEU91413.1 TAXI family TRAP transporter solute-binding subunit [Streptomyces kanamyceticus]
MFQALPHISRRRALQGSAAALVVFGLLLWWLLPMGESSPSGRVTVSTGVRNAVYEHYGKLLKTAISRDMPDVDVELINSEGSQQNVERVATGKADFTIAAADAVEKYRLEGKPGADRLRGCARLYDDYVQLVVPRSSDVESAEDLRNLRVAVGQDRSGVRLIADRVLEAAGLDPAKDITPVAAGIDTMPELLKKDKIDAFFWSGGLPTDSVRELSEEMPVRLVKLGGLVNELHKQGGASRYYRAATMPADAYPSAQQGSAVPTLAVANLLVTTDRADPELTEGLTRSVIDSRDHIGAQVHAAQLVDLRTALYTDPLTLHEGARRYYRSVKP